MNKEDNFATYQEYNFLNNVREELEKEVNVLDKQLQAYKEREDKLRELCENVRQHDWEAYDVSLEILDILGENNND